MERTALGLAGKLSRTKQSAQDKEPMRIENTSVPVVVLVSSQHGGVGIIRSLGRTGVPVYGVHQRFVGAGRAFAIPEASFPLGFFFRSGGGFVVIP